MTRECEVANAELDHGAHVAAELGSEREGERPNPARPGQNETA
jgi:hypothetical protein